jgi:predicted secreted protein
MPSRQKKIDMIITHHEDQKWFKDAIAAEEADREKRNKMAARHAEIYKTRPESHPVERNNAAWKQVREEFSSEDGDA